MSNGEEKLKLTDLIDIEFLQKLQDTFAKAMGIASLTVDDKGPITQRSNFSEFCTDFIRACSMGSTRCNESDIEGGKMALEAGEPVIYSCHAGLGHFAVPVIVDGQNIASILGGQFAFKKPDERHFKNLAKELRIPNEREYIKALRKIKIHSREHIQLAADLLFLVSNAISEIAHKNLELININKKEHFYREVIDAIRSSLDIEKTLFIICEAMAKFFNVQRASVSEAPPTREIKRPTVRMEYKTILDMDGLGTLIHYNEIAEYYFKVVEKGEVLAIDNISESDEPDYFKESYNALGIKSLLAIPIQKEEKWGLLILSEYNNYRHWSDEEIDIAKSIANQIYIAIKHAEAYGQEKKTANRENLLRRLIETIRSSLDINQVKNIMLKEICNALGANRCFIIEYDNETNMFLPVKNEYLISEDIKSIIGFDLKKEASALEKMNREGKEIILPDLETFLKENNLYNTSTEKHFREYGVKSGFSVPISYQSEMLGILAIHYTSQEKAFDYDEVDLIRTLSNQIAIAMHQAKLYEQEKKISIKEITLRETVKIIRSTLDSEKIRNNFLDVACTYFGADRCIFDEYDKETKEFLPFRIERLKSDDIKSLIGVSVEGDFPEFADKLKNKKRNIIIKDVEKTLARKELKNYKAIQTLHGSDAKSDYGFIVQYQDEILGILILHYVKEKKVLNSEELEFLKILRDQAGIALHQAELYEKSKRHARKEAMLRGITERIRSSLDINETLGIIANETAKLFDVDRIAITEFPDKNNFKNHIIRKEYKAFESIKSPTAAESYLDVGAFIANNIVKSGKPVIIENIEESDFNELVISFYNTLEVKSVVWVPIVSKKNELWGFMTLSTISRYKSWSHEDISFLNSISNQIYIAINQAELFDKSESQAKREILLREIAERIRSSLNIEDTLSFICEETAKLFNVQRTAITSFPHPENYEIFVVRKEYKYWPDMEGFGFKEHSAKAAAYWAEALIEGGNVLSIDNVDQADVPDYFKNTYTSMGVKAIMGTAIRRGNDVCGTLVLTEYNNYRHWSEDEKNLLKTIADQVYIAINQAELYERAQKKAENERILREIMLASVRTFDMKEMIHSLVTEAGKLFEADRCFFIEVDNETNTNLAVQDYAEYRSSEDILSHTARTPQKEETTEFVQRTRKRTVEYSVDVRKEPIPDAAKKFLADDLGVKSYLISPVFYGEICYGAFVLHYVKNYRQFSDDDAQMAAAVANQSAVILHQAELFELTKAQAEREKISKNIIEILRSTLDRGIIKRLFVKNIGQFLQADRVIFSEFNPNTKNYNPVGLDSEYLSEPDIKSFVGYDWACDEAQEFIQQILEKRELHIYNWHEYIQGNYKGQDFINLFESMGIQSSYSFPVMYQQKIMGFFSIGFVKKVRRLSDEDINRVRSICTQAGIALYHAHLYEDAQKSVQEHDKFVNKLSSELNEPLNLIADFSAIKSRHELECAEEVEHLNTINTNAKKLLYFLEDITKSMKKLNLE